MNRPDVGNTGEFRIGEVVLVRGRRWRIAAQVESATIVPMYRLESTDGYATRYYCSQDRLAR